MDPDRNNTPEQNIEFVSLECGSVQRAEELLPMNIQGSPRNAEEKNETKRYKTKYENVDQETNDEIIEQTWSSVRKDPSKFNRWTYLIRMVVNENNLPTIRKVYTEFLHHFPMCYDYWRKYAEIERKNNNIEEFGQIINAGVNAAMSSVDLWVNLLLYKKITNTDVDEIRELYEFGVNQCGLHFHSDRLWNDYITWEIDQNEKSKAFKIFRRLISTPTKEYLKNFENFQLFLSENSIDEIYDGEEFINNRSLIIEKLTDNNGLIDNSILSGEEVASNEEAFEKMILQKLREELDLSINEIHKKTTEEFKLRENFEKNIYIPYFNVNKLGALQIENWKNYIEFEEQRDDKQRIAFLYERCMIPCALIEVLWKHYLDFLEAQEGLVNNAYITNVYSRACFLFPKSLELNLRYADFQEFICDSENAKKILVKLEKEHPFSIEIANRLIQFARLRHDLRGQDYAYERYLNADVKYGYSKHFISTIAIKYANVVWKTDNKHMKAINIINSMINKYNISVNEIPEMYLTLINVIKDIKPMNVARVIYEFDKILNSNDTDLKQKVTFSKEKVEYIEGSSRDYELLNYALKEYKGYAKKYENDVNINF